MIKKKIVLLGDGAVGKTSLIRRYVFNQFDGSYVATIGSRVSMKMLKVQRPSGTHDLTFMIWDLIGREGYRALHARTFVGVHGAILVADLTRPETVESLERYWIPLLFKVVDQVPIVFACNKSDLPGHEFEPEDIGGITSRVNGSVEGILPAGLEMAYSTSAKDGNNVEKVFETMGHMVMSKSVAQNPVKELYEAFVSTGIQRSSDKTTAVGALDAIIIDFCGGFDDTRMAMTILRQELIRAGLDINEPTKDGIHRTVEYLAEAECEFKDERTVRENLKRRKALAGGIIDNAHRQ